MSVAKRVDIGGSLYIVAAHERIVSEVSALGVKICRILQVRAVSALVVAERGVEIPDRTCEELAVNILVEVVAGKTRIPVACPLLNEILLRPGDYVYIICVVLVEIIVAGLAVECILHLLPVAADILYLRLRGKFGGLHNDRLSILSDKSARLVGIAIGDLELKQVAAGYVFGLVGDIIPALAVFDIAAELADALGSKGREVEIGVQILGIALKVGYVDAVLVYLDLLGDEINALVFTVDIEVDASAIGRLGHADIRAEIIDYLVAQEAEILIVRDEAPALCLFHAEKLGFLIKLDVVRLFGIAPGRVASALHRSELGIIIDLALRVDSEHCAALFFVLLVGVNPVESALGSVDEHCRKLARSEENYGVVLVADGKNELTAFCEGGCCRTVFELDIAAHNIIGCGEPDRYRRQIRF